MDGSLPNTNTARQSYSAGDPEDWLSPRPAKIDPIGYIKKPLENIRQSTGNTFPGYHLRNTMKFARNYAFMMEAHARFISDFVCAKGCVDHNYAYEVWLLATELSLSAQCRWIYLKWIYN